MKKIITLIVAMVLTVCASISLVGCGKEKPVIAEDIVLLEEQYGIAGKKGNDALVSKINEALIALADNKMQDVAKTYGLNSEIAVSSSAVNPLASATDKSWENLVARKKVVIGYTVFAPIAYELVNGVPTKGYDIDLAKEVFNYLNEKYSANIAIEFLEIEWKAKETLLAGGSIDLIWNGLTITEDREKEMCISIPYLNNKQVAVIMSSNAKNYTSIEKMSDAITGAEDGSAGEEQIELKKIGKEYIKCVSQLDAFNKLKTGTLNVIVIDSVMANYYLSLED